eukprot:gene15821-17416_t
MTALVGCRLSFLSSYFEKSLFEKSASHVLTKRRKSSRGPQLKWKHEFDPKHQHTRSLTQGKALLSTNSESSFSGTSEMHNLATKLQPVEGSESKSNDGPEPSYERIQYSDEEFYSYHKPFHCHHGGILPKLEIAYETWGQLNERKDNAILLFSGLSGSSHAKSHSELKNSQPGWWENFIGPGCKIDTNKYYVICANHLGSCYGTTGPSSINAETNKPYGGDFPIISIEDIVRAQFILLDHMQIEKVHAVIGSSLGGMISLLFTALYPERVGRMISISACAAANPTAIAFRYVQRLALMSDPAWRQGNYYKFGLPAAGMQLARKIATLTYRSGPEWEERFGRDRIKKNDVQLPRICGSEFEIEDYISHQGENFFKRSQYDPNSMIYLSKAMDLFDMSDGFENMEEGLARIRAPSLIMGASSDILFPSKQQVELYELIRNSGNTNVILKIIEGHYGHDTFLLDVNGMGSKINSKHTAFLELVLANPPGCLANVRVDFVWRVVNVRVAVIINAHEFEMENVLDAEFLEMEFLDYECLDKDFANKK